MNSDQENPTDSQILDDLIKNYSQHNSISMNHYVEDIITFGQQYLNGSNSSFALFDIDRDYVFFNKSDITQHLFRPAVHTDIKENRKLINDITHPDDLAFWDKTFLDAFKMMLFLPVEELHTYRVVGSRRLKEKDEQYHSYIQQIEPLVIPGMKYLRYIILKTYRVKDEDIPQFRLYSRFMENDTEEHEYSVLLKNLKLKPRVMEAINLYIEDNTEEKIALKMRLRLSTVKGYFREIKKGMKVGSIKVTGLIWKQLKETGSCCPPPESNQN